MNFSLKVERAMLGSYVIPSPNWKQIFDALSRRHHIQI
jgi:hypothetical protein